MNDLAYYTDEGRVGSPLSAKAMRVFPYAGESVRRIKELGFRAIVISNQPGVAKRQFTRSELTEMSRKMGKELAKEGASLDSEYFCLHHPDAVLPKYRKVCDCRKPKPGLLLQAARERGIDLHDSYFVGDALVDVKAGRAAGCKTILVGHPTSFLFRMMEEQGATPDFIVPSLKEVPDLLISLEEDTGRSGGRATERNRKTSSRRLGKR